MCWVKAETLPAGYQAELAKGSGKGVARGSKDAGVAELADALNALSVGVHVAASGPGVVDAELSDVLAHLDITPGQPAHSAATGAS